MEPEARVFFRELLAGVEYCHNIVRAALVPRQLWHHCQNRKRHTWIPITNPS